MNLVRGCSRTRPRSLDVLFGVDWKCANEDGGGRDDFQLAQSFICWCSTEGSTHTTCRVLLVYDLK